IYWVITRSSILCVWSKMGLCWISGTIVCLVEPPYAERHVRWWCDALTVAKMREGPSTGTTERVCQTNLCC
ncbi:MAG: hypothetical protein PHU24_02740, partial [Sphaerochaetaceae bacterium]|nr:hypothetical protein [Sphaerochaetaceae bacterium]